MKVSAAEFKRFYEDESFWPEGVFHDDTDIAIDGVSEYDDNAISVCDAADSSIVTFSCGDVYGKDGEFIASFPSYFKRWKKKQETEFVVVSIHKDKLEALSALVKSVGGKIQ